jgi:hypothetical protein
LALHKNTPWNQSMAMKSKTNGFADMLLLTNKEKDYTLWG